jgi:ParB-like chromosome segregation protein Spo0J
MATKLSIKKSTKNAPAEVVEVTPATAEAAAQGMSANGTIACNDPRLVVVGRDEFGSDHWLFRQSAITEPPEWMIGSIAKVGVQQPVGLTEVGGKLLVVWGVTRVNASRKAMGKRKDAPPIQIPYILVDHNEKRDFTRMVQENVLRRSISWDENVENATRAKTLLGLSPAKIATDLYEGTVTDVQVRNWIAYGEKLHPLIKEAVTAGRLTPTAALEFLKGNKDHKAQLAEFEEVMGIAQKSNRKTGKVQAKSVSKAKAPKDEPADDEGEAAPSPSALPAGISRSEVAKLVKLWTAQEEQGKLAVEQVVFDAFKSIIGDASYNRVKGLARSITTIRS